MNFEKTKVVGLNKRREPLTVGLSLIEVHLRKVKSFIYLGTLVDENARRGCDIRARTGMAKATSGQLRKILVNLSFGRAARVRLQKRMYGQSCFLDVRPAR